jgi:hypothetical protein
MFIAPNLSAFKTQFATGLNTMLNPEGLGAFILVLANSMQDTFLREMLRDDLNKTFAQLHTAQPNAPKDDLDVVIALTAIGIHAFSDWQHHILAPWEVVINPLRSLRPARVSSEPFTTLHQPFDNSRFHFNKPFLRPEILWEDTWQGTPLRVMYNKFPFAPWHLLVVPEPDLTLPQYMTAAHHALIMHLVAEQATILPGLGMAFNSVGAYASINQLHFQGFVREQPFPVESPHWQHNGGNAAYPLECWRTTSVQEAWQLIDNLHRANQPYNVLYRADACYILPRKGQGTVALPAWAQGIGWHELCGVFTLADTQMLATFREEIPLQLAKLHH